MGTENIIKLANNIKNKYKGFSILDIIKRLNIRISYTNLNPKIYPAYTLNINGNPTIILNSEYDIKSQNVLAAHELGHALLHKDNYYNQFGDERNGDQEYEANLFAVSLLFNEDDFNIKFTSLTNYELKYLLDLNIRK